MIGPTRKGDVPITFRPARRPIATSYAVVSTPARQLLIDRARREVPGLRRVVQDNLEGLRRIANRQPDH